MVGCVQKELNSMKEGLHDVIPLDLLSGLAAEVGQHLYVYRHAVHLLIPTSKNRLCVTSI